MSPEDERENERENERPLLLDTHVWVWYVENEPGRLSRHLEPIVERAVQRGNVVISAISVWEIAMLEAARRIELSVAIRAWVGEALAFPGVRLKGLSPSVAIESTRLPDPLHRDPADRILIATARLLGAALVTCDARILAYAAHGHVRVIDATP